MALHPEATLGNTIGAAYLGVIGAAILFGITNLQVYMYYQHYSNDWRYQKISVAVLWFLDTFHLALTIHAVYHYVVDSFGNFLALDGIIWSFKLQIAVNVIIIVFVQSLYAARVWKLGRHYSQILPWIVIIVVALGYAIGIILAVKTYNVKTFSGLDQMAWAVYASFFCSTFIDFVIAGTMCFYLQRSRSGFSDTNSKIIAIMRYVLASGFATSICSMAALITYAAMPYNLVFLGIEFLLTKLYINSYLAMLNARQSVRERDTTSNSVSISKIMNVHTVTSPSDPKSMSGPPTPVDINDKQNMNVIRLTPLEYHHGHIRHHDSYDRGARHKGREPEASDNYLATDAEDRLVMEKNDPHAV